MCLFFAPPCPPCFQSNIFVLWIVACVVIHALLVHRYVIPFFIEHGITGSSAHDCALETIALLCLDIPQIIRNKSHRAAGDTVGKREKKCTEEAVSEGSGFCYE